MPDMIDEIAATNATDAPQEISYTYDDAGRQLIAVPVTTTLAAMTYNAAGEVSSASCPNGSSPAALGKDDHGRMLSHTWRTSDTKDVVTTVARTRSGAVADRADRRRALAAG